MVLRSVERGLTEEQVMGSLERGLTEEQVMVLRSCADIYYTCSSVTPLSKDLKTITCSL